MNQDQSSQKLEEREKQKHQQMMARGQGISVRIKSEHQERFSDGSIRVLFWTKKERMLRAVKFGAMCWGMALISVILPLLHFVLVPGFFLAGPAVTFWVLGQESVVLGGEGTCPSCKTFLPIVRSSYRFPLSDVCGSCYHSLKIEPAKPSK